MRAAAEAEIDALAEAVAPPGERERVAGTDGREAVREGVTSSSRPRRTA